MRLLSCSLIAAAATNALAQEVPEDADLGRLPSAATQKGSTEAAPTSNPANRRIRIDDVLTGWENQSLPVPPPDTQPSWQNRLSFDADLKYSVTSSTTFAVSDRLNAYAGDTIPSVSSSNLQNDFREAYIAEEFLPRSYVELGRINLREGIAYGYDPTDFFKTRTAVVLSSLDPSVAREDRLGVAMIEAQKLYDGANVSAAFAPRLQTTSPISTTASASFDPHWGRTNSANRGLITASWTASPFNPQVLAFYDGSDMHWGASASHIVNSSTVTYLEWAGTREANLTVRAVDFGVDTGSLPAELAGTTLNTPAKQFSNDVTAGASWTSNINLTVSLEYHYHQSGLTDAEFGRLINAGRAGPQAASLYWYVQQFASDQEEPLTKGEFFIRADWQDVIPSTLNLGGVAFVSQRDSSALAQLSAQYFLSRSWTVSVFAGTTFGSTQSVFGSTPWKLSGIVQLLRYL